MTDHPRWGVIDAPPVSLGSLTPDQLGHLRVAILLLVAGEQDEALLDSLWTVREDPQLLAFLWQQLRPVDDEYMRQREILDAAELDLADGHIFWVNYDDMDPEAGWEAFCHCGWESRGLPDEQTAERLGAAHDQLKREGR